MRHRFLSQAVRSAQGASVAHRTRQQIREQGEQWMRNRRAFLERLAVRHSQRSGHPLETARKHVAAVSITAKEVWQRAFE